MSDFYSGWLAPPNGYAKYRLHLSVTVSSQNVEANTTTLEWWVTLEKSRSQNGFYDYNASWSATINGGTVLSGSGKQPSGPWTGWSSWTLGHGWTTVTHDADGTKTIGVTGTYAGANSGWAIGTVTLVGDLNMTLPPIPRATTPTVSPSPATINTDVTISLPRAAATFTHDLTWVSGALSGTIATGVATSQVWTVPDVMAQFPGKTLAPIAITATTKSGTTVVGSKQVTLLAKEPPEPPVVTPHDPKTQFDVRARLVKYTSATGEWSARQQIPANSLQLVDPNSATATCTIGLSKLNSVDFEDYSIVDVDVFDGTDWHFTNHRFVLSRTDTDDIDPTKVGNYTGTEFVDYELGFAYLPVDYIWDGSEGHAGPTSPGEMIRYSIVNAQSRGWGPRIAINFDGWTTSLGEPWANQAVSRTFSKGTPISQMLSSLVEDGLLEYRTEYHDNKAWLVLLNPGTGSDYSADGSDPIVNLNLINLSRAPRRSTMEKRLTAVTVAGDDTVQVTREKAPFDPDVFGRMEGWVSASGVKDTTAANTIGDNALRDNSTPTSERTFEYQAQEVPAQFYPYVVFQPGDWVLIPDGDNSIKDRINQLTINKTADNALSLTVLTGDRILSGTASLAKRQAAQTGGSISGGSGTTPSPLDSRIPSAPVVNSVTSVGYWNSDGAAKSAVTLTWAAVTQAMNSADITVDLYEVWWRPAGIDAEWAFRGATDELSVTLGDWDVLQSVEFRIRARSVAGVYGEFSEDQEHITQAPGVDLGGPIISDLYTDGVGSIYVVWAGDLNDYSVGGTGGGYGVGGYGDGGYGSTWIIAPARLAYVVAEVSSDGGATYTTMGTPIAAAGSIVINPGAYGDYMVRIRGYDRLGNPGDASAAQAISLVDPRVLAPTPAAPTGLTVTPGASWDASGFFPTAWFDLSWTAPTVDDSGNPVTIVGYDIWGKSATETVLRFLTSSQSTSVRVPVQNDEDWSFQVSATSDAGGVSALSTPVTGTADATIAPPTAPTAPTLSQYAGLLQIKWAGGGMVPQIKYAFASISTSSTGTYTRAGMPLNGAGEVVVPGLAPGTYYAKMNLVDERGQTVAGPASDPIVLLPITGVTVQTSELANTGIKMTSAALTAYDASGNPTFVLNAATGEVWIAPYDAVFDLGATGNVATTGAATTGIAISSDNSSFNTFVHPAGLQIRNDQTPLSWWEADASDANLVNFFSPRAVIGDRLRIGDYEMVREAKSVGSRLVIRYKGA